MIVFVVLFVILSGALRVSIRAAWTVVVVWAFFVGACAATGPTRVPGP